MSTYQTQSSSSLYQDLKAYSMHPSSESNKAEEPSMAYGGSFFDNKWLLMQTIRKGLPFRLFEKIKKIAPFSDDDWAEYLNISKKTFQRHQNDAAYLFKPIHTEKIIELAEVNQFGIDVFEDAARFHLWLNTPSFALSNQKPAELLKDSYGKALVMAELGRIQHGIFA